MDGPNTEQLAHAAAMEVLRNEKELKQTKISIKSTLISTATSTLLENDRQKPVGERGISAEDITTFADTLYNYVIE